MGRRHLALRECHPRTYHSHRTCLPSCTHPGHMLLLVRPADEKPHRADHTRPWCMGFRRRPQGRCPLGRHRTHRSFLTRYIRRHRYTKRPQPTGRAELPPARRSCLPCTDSRRQRAVPRQQHNRFQPGTSRRRCKHSRRRTQGEYPPDRFHQRRRLRFRCTRSRRRTRCPQLLAYGLRPRWGHTHRSCTRCHRRRRSAFPVGKHPSCHIPQPRCKRRHLRNSFRPPRACGSPRLRHRSYRRCTDSRHQGRPGCHQRKRPSCKRRRWYKHRRRCTPCRRPAPGCCSCRYPDRRCPQRGIGLEPSR